MERNAHSPKLKLEMVDDWQLTTLDVDKVCRVCLQEKLLAVRIFAADYSIITMIESCTDVKVSQLFASKQKLTTHELALIHRLPKA